jgi:hypothetical protein
MMTYTSTKNDESRRDMAAIQYEQILNAGLSYYINNSVWPNSITDLTADKYLPNKTNMNNPWRGGYTFYHDASTGTFSVCSTISGIAAGGGFTSMVDSGILASRLPMGYVAESCPADTAPEPATCTTSTCAVVATVNIPGQNLNNARSVNFAGLYHNGACVPAPVCPNPFSVDNPNGMKPAILVVPAAVNGNYYGTDEVFPLSSFTAYATGDPTSVTVPAAEPGQCKTPGTALACELDTGNVSTAKYWRVCLDVVTQKGRIGVADSVWNKDSGAIMAITRCMPNTEPSGSGFSVFQSF